MNGRLVWGLVAAVAMPLSVGCAGNGTVVRGQNPAIPEAAAEVPGMPVGTHATVHNHLAGHVQHSLSHIHGPISTYGGSVGGAGCADGSCNPACSYPNNCCCLNCLGPGPNYDAGWYPTHHHWYTYREPRNLLYPPENAPAAVVVYPYYTVKGPDDFFLDDPERRARLGY